MVWRYLGDGLAPCAGSLFVQAEPFHSQVSPRNPLRPAPPNRTITWRSESYAIAEPNREEGLAPPVVTGLVHAIPSHSQTSFNGPVASFPPNTTVTIWAES